MAKSDESEICKQFVMAQLTDIQHQLDQCGMELITQTHSSVLLQLPSVEDVDSCLKEYVRLQQNHLFKRIHNQLIIYKDDICDQKLYHQLSAYNITTPQQQTIQQLINLRQIQLGVYEELIMLHERILHQFLPSNFDQLQACIAQEYYWPPIADYTLVDIKTKRRKILQQGKRAVLTMYVSAYKFKINDYEQQYERVLNELELNFASSTIVINGITPFRAVKAYMDYRTDRIKREINYKITRFRQIITHNRQRSSTKKKIIGVSPQVTIDVLHHTLNDDELAYLSRGKRLIIHSIYRIRIMLTFAIILTLFIFILFR
jgi:hypothetical protein